MDPPEICPHCGNKTYISFFDTIWHISNTKEKYAFDLLAALCKKCSQLYVMPDLIEEEELEGLRCKSAIESDEMGYPNYIPWKDDNPSPDETDN